MVIADSANLIRDPDLLDASYWSVSTGGVFGSTEAPEVTAELIVPRAIRSQVGNGTTSQAAWAADSALIPVLPDAMYRIAAKINNRATFTGQTRIGLEWYDRAGSYISPSWLYGTSYITSAVGGTSVIQTVSGQLQAPATAYYAKYRCLVEWSTTLSNTSRAYFGALSMQRAVNSDLIVDGAITAAKLSVTSLDAITATIGLLRTASTGARMELESNQGRVYDSGGTLRVRWGVW